MPPSLKRDSWGEFLFCKDLRDIDWSKLRFKFSLSKWRWKLYTSEQRKIKKEAILDTYISHRTGILERLIKYSNAHFYKEGGSIWAYYEGVTLLTKMSVFTARSFRIEDFNSIYREPLYTSYTLTGIRVNYTRGLMSFCNKYDCCWDSCQCGFSGHELAAFCDAQLVLLQDIESNDHFGGNRRAAIRATKDKFEYEPH